MKFPIGFSTGHSDSLKCAPQSPQEPPTVVPSMVLVRFPQCNIPLSYYNDQFHLKREDIVFVEGKYAGTAGRVEKVSTDFYVDLENYKKVLGVADTDVHGSFQSAGSHLITFDRTCLPYSQALTWFKALSESGSFYIQYEEPDFPLHDCLAWPFSQAVMDRGSDYYMCNKVVYLCVNGEQGRAIVLGSTAYEVRFLFRGGQITSLSCDCPCGFHCKHEAAALMQLRETLKIMEESDPQEEQEGGYFAIIEKGVFLSRALNRGGKLTLL